MPLLRRHWEREKQSVLFMPRNGLGIYTRRAVILKLGHHRPPLVFDQCVLARAHLYDPYWTRHAAQAQGYDLPWPGPYAGMDDYTPRV